MRNARCLPLRESSLFKGSLSRGGRWPSPREQTNICEIIALPQTSFAGGKNTTWRTSTNRHSVTEYRKPNRSRIPRSSLNPSFRVKKKLRILWYKYICYKINVLCQLKVSSY